MNTACCHCNNTTVDGEFYPQSTVKGYVSELFLDIFISSEQVTNLENGEVLDNILDDNDKHVPGPELGNVGVNTKRTFEVKDVLQDLCNDLKAQFEEKQNSHSVSQTGIE